MTSKTLLDKDAFTIGDRGIFSFFTKLAQGVFRTELRGVGLIPARPGELLRAGGGEVDGGDDKPGHHHHLQQEGDQGEEQGAHNAAHSLDILLVCCPPNDNVSLPWTPR